MTDAYTTLLNNGPTPGPELEPAITSEQRQDGIQNFNPDSPRNGGSTPGSGTTAGVYYIRGKHDPETVVELWLEINSNKVSRMSNWALHKRIASAGDEFKAASRELIEFDREFNPGNGTTKRPCPFCGADDIKSIPIHLPKCEERP